MAPSVAGFEGLPDNPAMPTRYLFITGGVVSSLGKGIVTASLSLLLQRRGLKVVPLKFDPYLNVDPGTMNPYQHGEVYVTEDGAETDLDLGHYERFLHQNMHSENNVTAGQVYYDLIRKERAGKFLGKTVQVVPHLTREIQERIRRLAREGVAVVIVEVGGTVGDIESLPFLEAIRQFHLEIGKDNALFVHLTLVPYLGTAEELKTKPTQHSVMKLREIGIQPDFILCRSEKHLPKNVREKIALFTNVPMQHVFEIPYVGTIYEVPLVLHKQGVDQAIADLWHLPGEPDLADWTDLVKRIKHPRHEVTVALAGKYVHMKDTYKSVYEALTHAAAQLRLRVHLRRVDTQRVEREGAEPYLRDVDAVLVPGGFGKRGVEGMIQVARYAREHGLPYLGLCLGMQVAVIEFARHVVGWADAHSTEFDPQTPHPVIVLLPEQRGVRQIGGTLRLGSYEARVFPGTRLHRLYGADHIVERHRHRYEFNPEVRGVLEQAGLKVAAESVQGGLVEAIELPDHPFFVAVQYHPEFKSRPLDPHPLFVGFLKAALEHRERRYPLLAQA